MKLSRIEHIDSGHYIPDHPKCGRPHGHTYKVEVTIESQDDADMVLEFGEFKKVLWGILSRYDHLMLNDVMTGVPTVENFARELHSKLAESLLQFRLTVRVWEGVGKWAECVSD